MLFRSLAELREAMATMVRMEEHRREQVRMLEEVNRSEARLRSIFDNAAVGIARVAIDGRFLEVNARFAEIAGWSPDALLAGGFQQITPLRTSTPTWRTSRRLSRESPPPTPWRSATSGRTDGLSGST